MDSVQRGREFNPKSKLLIFCSGKFETMFWVCQEHLETDYKHQQQQKSELLKILL